MGGDADHKDCIRIANYIHETYPNIKVGMYSGRDIIDIELALSLDYYKIGRWILPKDNTNSGPIQYINSNQIMFMIKDKKMINITDKFRDKKLNNLNNFIIK